MTDKPKVVDFAAVKRALAEAKKPLRAKLEETQLKERFEDVANVEPQMLTPSERRE